MVSDDKHPKLRLTKEILAWCKKLCMKFSTVKKFNQVLSCSVVKVHAIKIAKQLGIADFKASKVWLYRHNKKYGLKSLLVSGEGDDVYPSDLEIQKEIGEIKQMLTDVDPEVIYNMDKTGLIYRKMPDCTYITHSEMKLGKLYLKTVALQEGFDSKGLCDCHSSTSVTFLLRSGATSILPPPAGAGLQLGFSIQIRTASWTTTEGDQELQRWGVTCTIKTRMQASMS
eukprot:2808947-Rhodomonas_salina.1